VRSSLSLIGRIAAAAIGVVGIAGAALAVTPAFAENSVNAFAVSDIYEMTQGETLTVTDPGLLLNDTTTSGGELEVQSIQGDTAGLVLNSGNKGGFTFTPDPSFNGAATFDYVLIEINTATTSDPTSVVIIVNPAAGEEGNDPDPAPCEAGQPCGGDGTGTAGSGLDDPCAPADPNAPQTPAEVNEVPADGAPECPLPPCDPDAPQGPASLPGEAGEPTCIPVIPPCDPDAPDAPASLPGEAGEPTCIPVIPPCDDDALPTTPENAPDCIPTGNPGSGSDIPCAVGTPGCGPAADDPAQDTPPTVLDTLPASDGPAAQPSPTVAALAHTGSTAPNYLAAAGLLLLATGAAALLPRRRRTA
jgi:LPXTG-motif cell wall-anchored protein